MTDTDALGPIEPQIEPLLLSVGRAVLAAAALEKVLLVDIARRRADAEGFVERLGRELSRLERRPAGHLLRVLKDLGIAEDAAERIDDLIARRNRLVHHFMEDREVLLAFATGNADQVIGSVDQIALDCQTLINDIAPSAFGGLERLFGASLADLVEAMRSVDLDSVTDHSLRKQLEVVQALSPDELRSLRPSPPD